MSDEPGRHSSRGLAVLAFLAVGGSAMGVLVYQIRQSGSALPAVAIDKTSGFDINELPPDPAPSQRLQALPTPAPRPAQNPKVSPPVTSVPAARTAPPKKTGAGSADRYAAAAIAAEDRIRALAESYTRKYPVVARYGGDWMSYPDLKKLNDDYMKDHDPIKFISGVSASNNFAQLVKKYAGEPTIQSFIKESITQSPPNTLAVATEFLEKDQPAKTLVNQVAIAAGIPLGILEKPRLAQKKAIPDLDAAPAAKCIPPQPKAPCALNWFWDGLQCVDGRTLLDYSQASRGWSNDEWRSYFFLLIKRKGLPAEALPTSLAALEEDLVARGASLQRNSAGEIRGRLFLPTGDLDNPWARAVDVVQNRGWCDPWGWTLR